MRLLPKRSCRQDKSGNVNTAVGFREWYYNRSCAVLEGRIAKSNNLFRLNRAKNRDLMVLHRASICVGDEPIEIVRFVTAVRQPKTNSPALRYDRQLARLFEFSKDV